MRKVYICGLDIIVTAYTGHELNVLGCDEYPRTPNTRLVMHPTNDSAMEVPKSVPAYCYPQIWHAVEWGERPPEIFTATIDTGWMPYSSRDDREMPWHGIASRDDIVDLGAKRRKRDAVCCWDPYEGYY